MTEFITGLQSWENWGLADDLGGDDPGGSGSRFDWGDGLGHVEFHLLDGAKGIFTDAGIFVVLGCCSECGDDIGAENIFEDLHDGTPNRRFVIVEFLEERIDDSGLQLHRTGGPDGPQAFGSDGVFDFLAELVEEVGRDFLHQLSGSDADFGFIFIENGEEFLEVEVSQFTASRLTHLRKGTVEAVDEHLEGLRDLADPELCRGPGLNFLLGGIDSVHDQFLNETVIDFREDTRGDGPCFGRSVLHDPSEDAMSFEVGQVRFGNQMHEAKVE